MEDGRARTTNEKWKVIDEKKITNKGGINKCERDSREKTKLLNFSLASRTEIPLYKPTLSESLPPPGNIY